MVNTNNRPTSFLFIQLVLKVWNSKNKEFIPGSWDFPWPVFDLGEKRSIGRGHVVVHTDDKVRQADVFRFEPMNIFLADRGDGAIGQFGTGLFEVPHNAFVMVRM